MGSSVLDPSYSELMMFACVCTTAVMSALRGLQDKIRRLELERTDAEDNLRSLATETAHFSDNRQPLSFVRTRDDHVRLPPGEVTFGADTTQGTGEVS